MKRVLTHLVAALLGVCLLAAPAFADQMTYTEGYFNFAAADEYTVVDELDDDGVAAAEAEGADGVMSIFDVKDSAKDEEADADSESGISVLSGIAGFVLGIALVAAIVYLVTRKRDEEQAPVSRPRHFAE